MKKTTIAFVVLVVMLFAGIGILMKPTSLVPLSARSATGGGQLADHNPALKAVITVGSAFLLVGLVGLAALGFVISGKNGPHKKQDMT